MDLPIYVSKDEHENTPIMGPESTTVDDVRYSPSDLPAHIDFYKDDKKIMFYYLTDENRKKLKEHILDKDTLVYSQVTGRIYRIEYSDSTNKLISAINKLISRYSKNSRVSSNLKLGKSIIKKLPSIVKDLPLA